MKGITPVITTVLLLLMAVAAVGGAWVWYQRMQTSSMAGGSGQVEQIRQTAVVVSPDSLSCSGNDWSLALSNAGTGSTTITNVTLSTSAGGSANAYKGSWTVGADSIDTQTLSTVSGTCTSGTLYFLSGRIGASYIFRDYTMIPS
jgi:flagellin-like protein